MVEYNFLAFFPFVLCHRSYVDLVVISSSDESDIENLPLVFPTNQILLNRM